MEYCLTETKAGWIGLLSSPKGLIRTTLPKPSKELAVLDLGADIPQARHTPAKFTVLVEQLEEYFAGKIVEFTFTPDWSAYTVFQQAVWSQTRAIKYGLTSTYGQVASVIGRPGAARAVGQALHINPLPLIIPCHRVLGHDGSLHGFGGGLPMKGYLLDLEKRALKEN
jgi:methylated-DNA-[protein]-cysteine S-methyltransferase